jgi:uncharacterized protein (DUF2252 family)
MAKKAKKVRVMSERIEEGRSIRERLPRSAHAEWTAPATRPDSVATLKASNDGRLEELVPIRFGRMLNSPFAYLRGSAPVMATDLAAQPNTGVTVQLCGDCHLMNFGIFATPERQVVFGLNDFDESLPGPWEFDVKRLAASIAVAAFDQSMSQDDAVAAVEATTRSYRENLWRHVQQSPLDIWYDKIGMDEAINAAPDREARANRKRLVEKARQRVGDQLIPKLVKEEGSELKIVDQPPLIYHVADVDIMEVGRQFIENYRDSLSADRRTLLDRYRLRDAAIKVVGVGSVGTRCFVAVLESSAGFPLLLQIKEANRSVIETALGAPPASHNGERVVVGQRLMQPSSDIFLGWGTGAEGRHFYVRQLRDMKLSVTMTDDPKALRRYGEFCGRALARAHANSGDGPVIAGYLGKTDVFDRAMGTYSLAYAAQTVKDHRALADAEREGRVEAIFETI